MSSRRLLAVALANAMLAGDWHRMPMLRRCTAAFGGSGRWLRRLVGAVLGAFPDAPLDSHDALVKFIVAHSELSRAREAMKGDTPIHRWYSFEPRMRPSRWPVRALDTTLDIEAWLGLSSSDLAWLADRKGLEQSAADPRLQNYRYRWLRKPDGSARLLEAPKQRLKSIQRRVLPEILDSIPPHDAAQGFRRGRSVLGHARLHAGCETVVRFDLRAFFTHVSTARAYGVFRAAGYPEQVARTLIALCTNQAPLLLLREAPFELRQLLSAPHLPQGAPTSPALANLVTRSLDVRLLALAHRFGARYSRYADDLTFSGDRILGLGNGFERAVAEVVRTEGFALNPRKTRVMRSSRRQRVTGVVVNQGVNVPRDEADRLKATLHNCLSQGLESQARGVENFRAHLEGRVAWVEQLNPRRGARLRQMLARLDAKGPSPG